MDAVQIDDKVVVPDPVLPPVAVLVSAGPVEAGPTPIEQPTQAVERSMSEYATHQDVHVPPAIKPFAQPTIEYKPSPEIASQQPVSAMGTAKVNIKVLEGAFNRDPNLATNWEDGVEYRQEERSEEKAELPEAA